MMEEEIMEEDWINKRRQEDLLWLEEFELEKEQEEKRTNKKQPKRTNEQQEEKTPMERLIQLREFYKNEIITREEYEGRKSQIVNEATLTTYSSKKTNSKGQHQPLLPWNKNNKNKNKQDDIIPSTITTNTTSAKKQIFVKQEPIEDEEERHAYNTEIFCEEEEHIEEEIEPKGMTPLESWLMSEEQQERQQGTTGNDNMMISSPTSTTSTTNHMEDDDPFLMTPPALPYQTSMKTPEGSVSPLFMDFDMMMMPTPPRAAKSSSTNPKEDSVTYHMLQQKMMEHLVKLKKEDQEKVANMLDQNNTLQEIVHYIESKLPETARQDVQEAMRMQTPVIYHPMKKGPNGILTGRVMSFTPPTSIDTIERQRKRSFSSPLGDQEELAQPTKRLRPNPESKKKYKITINVVSATEHPHGHECSECHKLFTDKSNLVKHFRVHTKEQPFVCDHCGKRYRHSQTLAEHVQQKHPSQPLLKKKKNKAAAPLNQQRFACDQCSKTFKNEANRARHYRIHTGVKPYQCTICERKFNQSSNLKTHLRNIHQIHIKGRMPAIYKT